MKEGKDLHKPHSQSAGVTGHKCLSESTLQDKPCFSQLKLS